MNTGLSSAAIPRFDTVTGHLLRRCLRTCRYHDDLITENYVLSNRKNIPLVTFAHRPHDARSSCIAFLHQTRTAQEEIASLRELGVPLTFFVGPDSWEMWSLRRDGPRLEQSVRASELENFFDRNQFDFAPGAIFRAKTWARAEGARQLDFVDIGLLPLVEAEAGNRLRQLFEEMVAQTMDLLRLHTSSLSDNDAHWLVQANFWLLAGKLLQDKEVPNFKQLDLNDVQDVFDRVADHYAAQRVRSNGRLTALRAAARIAISFSSFRSVSTETLGALYEEALLSPRTRKLWSVHRTPTYLVDYMLGKLSRAIDEDLGVENCRIFEPACGHAPFLVGAVRLLSDLLPENIARNPTARRQFLRRHIGGCDRDSFALEIARLSLTLADIPNPNGWELETVADMFTGDYLQTKIRHNSVIVANPPFEAAPISSKQRSSGDLRYARSGQAAELLRRIVDHADDGTLFAVVVPQAILDGAAFRELRGDLLKNVDIREIVTFPDNVFRFAKPETAIVIGKKIIEQKPIAHSFKYRRLRKPDVDAFRVENRLPTAEWFSRREALLHRRHQLLLPPLSSVWSTTKELPRLDDVAHVTIGFYFYAETDASFPAGEVQVADSQKPGFALGFRLAERTPETHLIPKLQWLNQKESIIRRHCGGTKQGQPRIIMNHVRTGGGAWRHKAFIDDIGRPATDAFLLISPRDTNWTLETLWAVANSPFANAYTFTNSATKQIGVRLFKGMPVPKLAKRPHRLESAVETYLSAARRFSLLNEGPAEKGRHAAVNRNASALTEELPLGSNASPAEPLAAARNQLRALHWQVDAELLKLYDLPADAERALLDFFDCVPRIGVPYEQNSYIPIAFRDVLRLQEFLSITDNWIETDERRCELIERRLKHGQRTNAEETEFQHLQHLYDARRAYIRWVDTGDANASLIDEKRFKVIQQEDARQSRHVA